MKDLADIRNLISTQERKIANKIADEVLNKPKLNVWMILIPIVFLYYFYAFHRFATGKKNFVKSFLRTRFLILDQACICVETGAKADFQALAGQDNVPENAVEAYKTWAKALHGHYVTLLNTSGVTYPALIKAGYQEQSRYQTILEEILKAEILFYKALRKDLKKTAQDVGEVIKKIEEALAHLGQDESRLVFG